MKKLMCWHKCTGVHWVVHGRAVQGYPETLAVHGQCTTALAVHETCTGVQINLSRKYRQCTRPCSDTDQVCTVVHHKVHGRALPWLSRPTPACSRAWLMWQGRCYCTGVHHKVHGRAVSKFCYKHQNPLLSKRLELWGSYRCRKQAIKAAVMLLWRLETTSTNPLIHPYQSLLVYGLIL